MKKRIIAALLASVMCIGMLTGCGSSSSSESADADTATASGSATTTAAAGGTVKVGFVNLTDADDCCYECTNRFREYCESDEFKESIGADEVEVYTADSANDIAKQTDNVETLLNKGVQVMFIIGVDTAGNTTAVEDCNAAGVPVYMVGTEADGGDFKFVGFDESDIGYQQAMWLAENAKEGAKICYLTGAAGREATVDQQEGFEKGLEESGRDDIEILSTQDGKWTNTDAMRVTEDWLQTFDEIDYIVSMDGKMASGALEALKGAQMEDQIPLVGVYSMGDWNKELITDGYMVFAVYKDWPSIGDLCGEVATKTLNGETVEDQTIFEMQNITPETVDEVIK